MLLPVAELLLGRSLGFHLKFPFFDSFPDSVVTPRKATANKTSMHTRGMLIPMGMADPRIWGPGDGWIPFQGCFSSCSIIPPPHQQPRNGNSGTIPVGDPWGKGEEQHSTPYLVSRDPWLRESPSPRSSSSLWKYSSSSSILVGIPQTSALSFLGLQNYGITESFGLEKLCKSCHSQLCQVIRDSECQIQKDLKSQQGLGAPALPWAAVGGQTFPGGNCSQIPTWSHHPGHGSAHPRFSKYQNSS